VNCFAPWGIWGGGPFIIVVGWGVINLGLICAWGGLTWGGTIFTSDTTFWILWFGGWAIGWGLMWGIVTCEPGLTCDPGRTGETCLTSLITFCGETPLWMGCDTI